MSNLLEILLELLRQDERFISQDGSLMKNAVYEAAYKNDISLLNALYKNNATKNAFFTKIKDGLEVFDKVKFGWVISNKELLPDSYTRFANKIGLTDDIGAISERGDVVLTFPHKDCILEGGQTKEDQDRDEIFYNALLAPDEIDLLLSPKVFTSAKRYTKDSIDCVSELKKNENYIIKGNNLLVIQSLLKKYEGKIKCIYIDPPYNPKSDANTFRYNNTFNRSTWLTFMKNRLEVAKRLLSPTGAMIVAIDKNEQPRLHLLIEEIFGDTYDVDSIVVVHNPRGTIGTNFSYVHENAIFITPKKIRTVEGKIIDESEIDWSPLRNWGGESERTDAKNCFYPIYIKNEKIIGFGDAIYDLTFHPNQTEENDGVYSVYPIDSKNVERKWRYSRQKVELIKDNLRVKKTASGGYDIDIGKRFAVHKTVWMDSKYDANAYGTQLLKSIVPDSQFSYPKSINTVIDCVEAIVRNDPKAIIMDFFAGSGTTGQAVFEINKKDNGDRKFILVEQMDYIEDTTIPRIRSFLNTNDSFIYLELKKLNQIYIDEICSTEDASILERLYKEICESPFICRRVKPREVKNQAASFSELSTTDKKMILMKLLDLNMIYVNYSDIEDKSYDVSTEDKYLNHTLYGDFT